MDGTSWIPSDLIADVLYAADIVIRFLTTFDEGEGGQIDDLSQIAKRYATGNFAFDVVSVLPLELLSFAIGGYHPAMRLNRLLRTPNVMLFATFVRKWSNVRPSSLRIFKSVFTIVLMVHIIACLFHLLVATEGAEVSDTFSGHTSFLSKGLSDRYALSFYWGFATVTGYNSTEPVTLLEVLFSTVGAFIGLAVFALIIGTVGSVVRNLDHDKIEFNRHINNIVEFMEGKNVPADLQGEVKTYFMYLFRSGRSREKLRALDDLPPYLKNKIKIVVNRSTVAKVPMFQRCKDERFIQDIVRSLKPMVCLPGSLLIRAGDDGDCMYFVARGEINVIDPVSLEIKSTMRDGAYLGHDALLWETKRSVHAAARTFCDIFVLTKEDFSSTLSKYPECHQVICEFAQQDVTKSM